MARILVVDDDRNCAAFLRLFLTDEGHEVRSAVSGKDAMQTTASFAPELLITDWLLKDGTDGLTIARSLKGMHAGMRVMFITGMPARDLRDQIRDFPDAQIFEKPLDLDRLLPLVNSMLAPVNPSRG